MIKQKNINSKNKIKQGLFTLEALLYSYLYPLRERTILARTEIPALELINLVKKNLGTSFFISWKEKDSFLNSVKDHISTNAISKIIMDADEVLSHTLNFLGSGKRTMGRNINWREDLATSARWPLIRSKQIPVMNKPGDIIRIWELSRFQWGPTLGKAYWLTGDEKYVNEFLHEVRHWIQHNPFRFGPNWMSSQDVAIRALNWILTLCFMGGSQEITSKDWRELVASLFLHGMYIERNLALNYLNLVRTTGTHYLSGLLGLLYLGLLFKDTKEGRRWLDESVSEFCSEIEYQVHEDGADYESSLACYHRFALEHFLSAYALFLLNNIEVPESYRIRLARMFEFVMAYTRPDGSVPQIGDTGDGRVHILSNYSSWIRDDHRYLLHVGGVLFKDERFRSEGNDHEEESFWLLHRLENLGKTPIKSAVHSRNYLENSCEFPVAGFYFLKDAQSCMAISANPVGMKGKGNHKHNDVFSFDLFFDGTAFIVDPGSYVYTSDLAQRHLFRSTAYHNTLQLDALEQNIINVDAPWRVWETAHPRVTSWESNRRYDFFQGEHAGYSNFFRDLIVERCIFFDKWSYVWIITDRLKHCDHLDPDAMVSVYFHLNDLDYEVLDHESRSVRLPDGNSLASCNILMGPEDIQAEKSIRVQSQDASIVISSMRGNDMSVSIDQGWVSTSYGIRKPAPIVTFSRPFQGQHEFTFIIEGFVGGKKPCAE